MLTRVCVQFCACVLAYMHGWKGKKEKDKRVICLVLDIPGMNSMKDVAKIHPESQEVCRVQIVPK